MIYLAGEPDDIWWNGEVKEIYLGADLVWKSGPTIEVYDVSRTGMQGRNAFHPLITLAPPPGQTWFVEIEGTVSLGSFARAHFVLGNAQSGDLGSGPFSWSGEITSTESDVGVYTYYSGAGYDVGFMGVVTVTIP